MKTMNEEYLCVVVLSTQTQTLLLPLAFAINEITTIHVSEITLCYIHNTDCDTNRTTQHVWNSILPHISNTQSCQAYFPKKSKNREHTAQPWLLCETPNCRCRYINTHKYNKMNIIQFYNIIPQCEAHTPRVLVCEYKCDWGEYWYPHKNLFTYTVPKKLKHCLPPFFSRYSSLTVSCVCVSVFRFTTMQYFSLLSFSGKLNFQWHTSEEQINPLTHIITVVVFFCK